MAHTEVIENNGEEARIMNVTSGVGPIGACRTT